MTPPTPHGIRSDAMGSGHYGALRGARTHRGTDYICYPGEPVYSPISGLVVRESRPYTDTYSGLLIRNSQIELKIFYFSPDLSLVGSYVKEGDAIGVAQDISQKYGDAMTPHIHVQVEGVDPELLMVPK